MIQICQCLGTRALLSEGKEGFVQALPCPCVKSLEPKHSFHDEDPEEWYSEKNEQDRADFENKWKEFESAKKTAALFFEVHA